MRLQGFYLSFGEQLDRERNTALHRLAQTLLEQPLAGVTDIVPGYTNLYLEYDARRLSEAQVRRWVERQTNTQDAAEARTIEIPVRYDGADLKAVSEQTGLSEEEVIRRHTHAPYHVYALGFTPGFPFMAEVDERLQLPRRGTPRSEVSAHSVAMTGAQTGIYPLPSPGGWHLLGTALSAVYDPHRAEPFLIRPGDAVSFNSAEGETPPQPKPLELLPAEPHTPLFKVHEPGLLDLVVDEGRFLAGRFGLSRSGPLDAPLAALANRLLANPTDAPLLELTLKGPTLEAVGDAVVSFTGWSLVPQLNGQTQRAFSSFSVQKGDVLSFKPTPTGCRSYLAVAGGVEAERFMGSASTDLKGLIGRPLNTGDLLGQRGERKAKPGRSFTPYRRFQEVEVLRLQPGPQADEEALASLTQHLFSVSSADRVGVRFAGASVPGGDVLSEATPLGALQITSGGTPILLMHDRGTLGGYAKPAQLHPADLGRAAQLRPGARVRFALFS